MTAPTPILALSTFRVLARRRASVLFRVSAAESSFADAAAEAGAFSTLLQPPSVRMLRWSLWEGFV